VRKSPAGQKSPERVDLLLDKNLPIEREAMFFSPKIPNPHENVSRIMQKCFLLCLAHLKD
jgi:hypothetical protein